MEAKMLEAHVLMFGRRFKISGALNRGVSRNGIVVFGRKTTTTVLVYDVITRSTDSLVSLHTSRGDLVRPKRGKQRVALDA